jgi:antirestriction protein ArdC
MAASNESSGDAHEETEEETVPQSELTHARLMMNLDAMRQHVESLAAEHNILLDMHWVKRTDRAYALRERDGASDEVQTPPIRSAITYATALHEIGHILGRHQNSRRSLVRERWAWQWARENAIVWTAAMERCAIQSLRHRRLRG